MSLQLPPCFSVILLPKMSASDIFKSSYPIHSSTHLYMASSPSAPMKLFFPDHHQCCIQWICSDFFLVNLSEWWKPVDHHFSFRAFSFGSYDTPLFWFSSYFSGHFISESIVTISLLQLICKCWHFLGPHFGIPHFLTQLNSFLRNLTCFNNCTYCGFTEMMTWELVEKKSALGSE